MASNPINLALRFILEITSLFLISYWGWHQSPEWLKYVLTIGLPIFSAVIWGVFAVKDDPSRSGKTVIPTPGIIRLLIELTIFGFACWVLYDLEQIALSIILVAILLIHHIASYDRIIWLIRKWN
ncbi:MAG: YrdB family protein [Mariniphaga sp.]|nr:YrdB family protein [Mariniphaga sp.]